MLLKKGCKMKACANLTQPETTTISSARWLEAEVLSGFRLWQIMFLCFAGVLTLIIMLCCCIRFRIPRTKQEIEADYVRKKITKKFQKQLRMIQNSDMDDMDLKRALDRIRAEFKSDTESLAQSDALSGATLSSGNYRDLPEKHFDSDTYRKASDLGISFEDLMQKERDRQGFMRRLPSLAGMISKFRSGPRKTHDVLD